MNLTYSEETYIQIREFVQKLTHIIFLKSTLL
jgi:hypothetical protein